MAGVSRSLVKNIDKYSKMHGWSVRELERRAGLNRGRVESIMRGSLPKADALAALAKIFGITVDELMSPEKEREVEFANQDEAQPIRTKPLPFYGEVPIGPPMVSEDRATYEVLEHLAKPGRYVLRATGESMAPTIESGDFIIVEHVTDPDATIYHDKICVVLLDGQTTLKRVRVHKRKNTTMIVLLGDSPAYPIDTFLLGERDFRIQGAVLRIVDRKLA